MEGVGIINSNISPWLLFLQTCSSCILRQLSPHPRSYSYRPVQPTPPPPHTASAMMNHFCGPALTHPVTHFLPSSRLYIFAKSCPLGKGLGLSPVRSPSPKPLVYSLSSLASPRSSGKYMRAPLGTFFYLFDELTPYSKHFLIKLLVLSVSCLGSNCRNSTTPKRWSGNRVISKLLLSLL